MIYPTAVKATTNRINEAQQLLQSLYSVGHLNAVKSDLENILLSENFNEYVLNNGFFEDITEYKKVKYFLELFPSFIYQ